MNRIFTIIGVLCCVIILGGVAFKGLAYYKVHSLLPSFDKFAIEFYRCWNDRDYERIYNELADDALRNAVELDDMKEFLEVIDLKYGDAGIKEDLNFQYLFEKQTVLLTVQCQVARRYGKFQETFEVKRVQKEWKLVNYHFVYNSLYTNK